MKKATIYTEFLAVALLITLFTYRFFRLHPAVALIIFAASYGISYLVTGNSKGARTVFMVVGVLGWSALAFFVSRWIGHVSDATAWVFGMLACLVAVLGYADVLEFRKYK